MRCHGLFWTPVGSEALGVQSDRSVACLSKATRPLILFSPKSVHLVLGKVA